MQRIRLKLTHRMRPRGPPFIARVPWQLKIALAVWTSEQQKLHDSRSNLHSKKSWEGKNGK